MRLHTIAGPNERHIILCLPCGVGNLPSMICRKVDIIDSSRAIGGKTEVLMPREYS